MTAWAPLVSVPVLSNSTVSIERMRSRASRSLTRIPAFADTAVEMAITSGIARPRACGQAITKHGDGAGDRGVEIADRPPHDERDDRGGDGDVEQQRGEAVGEHLSSALAGLGVGDEPLDPGQGGVVTDGVDTHPDRAVGRHRAGHHAAAD